MNQKSHTKIRSDARAGRLRKKTSRERRLKAGDILTWSYLFDRSRILPGEQYYESQVAAAEYFGVEQSTISRQIATLIKEGVITVVKDRRRGDNGLWTSKVIKVADPGTPLHAWMHVDGKPIVSTTSSTCADASLTTGCSPIDTKDNSLPTQVIENTHYIDAVSDAPMHVDEVVESKGTPPHARMHNDRLALADELVDAKEHLATLEKAAADTLTKFGNDGGWGRSISEQRVKVRELEQRYAAMKEENR